jgi:hypothetical protein
MKMMMKKGMLAAMLLAFVWGCKKSDPNGYMTVMMTDAPGDYLQVNVDIKQVSVHYANGNNWVNLNTNAGVYNLLTLQNNITTVLANNTQVPSGKVSQIRLLLGTNNTVMLSADSSIHPLKIPSAYTSGVKINVDAQIPSQNSVTITLDYDADASVNKEGNGDYIMNPVIRVKSIQ